MNKKIIRRLMVFTAMVLLIVVLGEIFITNSDSEDKEDDKMSYSDLITAVQLEPYFHYLYFSHL